MGTDIRFIRLDDDLCDILNRQSEETRQRVSDLANQLIRRQLRAEAESAHAAAGPPNTA